MQHWYAPREKIEIWNAESKMRTSIEKKAKKERTTDIKQSTAQSDNHSFLAIMDTERLI